MTMHLSILHSLGILFRFRNIPDMLMKRTEREVVKCILILFSVCFELLMIAKLWSHLNLYFVLKCSLESDYFLE